MSALYARVAAFLALLWIATAAVAESRPLTVKRLGPEEGLSQITARALAQDAEGLIWIGTENGLSLYDGQRFEYLRHDPQDPGSVSDNYIRALLPDPDGSMWVGTLGGGLSRYDRTTGRFVRYPAAGHEPLPSADIKALLGAADGSIWIGHGAGVSRLDPSSGKFHTQPLAHGHPEAGQPTVISLAQTADGHLWIGTNGQGLFRVDTQLQQRAHYHKGNGLSDDIVLALHADPSGQLWIGTERGGLNRLDPRSEKLEHIAGDYDPEVTAIVTDRDRALWFGTWSGGLYRLDPREGTLEQHRATPLLRDGLRSNAIISLLVDHDGLLWVGTYDGGAHLVLPYDGAFTRYAWEPGRADGLSHPMVWSLAEDASGALWIGTRQGLSRLSTTGGSYERYLASGRCVEQRPGVDVRALLPDGDSLWLGLADGGLVHFNPASCAARVYSDELTSKRVRLLLRGRSGELWVGTDRGLNRLDPRSGATHHYLADGTSGSLPHNRIRSLYQDATGTLWVGTSGGLSRYLPSEERFETFRAADGLLSDDDVRAIYRDESGLLWLATGIGLTRLDLTHRQARFFYESHGLSNNTLYSLVEDGPWLWISTNSGLTRFHRTRLTAVRFDLSDGLPASEFNFNAWTRTARGELLFGGIAGFVRIDPARIDSQRIAPRLRLRYGLDHKDTPRALPGATLELPEGQLVLYPQIIHYLHGPRLAYRYRLRGPDQEWVHQPARAQHLRYSGLAPGKHRIELVMLDSDGRPAGEPYTLDLRVPAPWMLQPWALVLYALAAALLLWAMLRIYSLALRRRAARLQGAVDQLTAELSEQNARLHREMHERKKLNATQQTFYSRISHELRTPLTLIVLPLERLLEAPLSPSLRPTVLALKRGVERLEAIVGDLIAVALEGRPAGTGTQALNLQASVYPILQLYQLRADTDKRSFAFAPLPDIVVTLHRAVFDDVLHNLLDNAFKYTHHNGCIQLSIQTDPEHSCLILEVQDDGVGLSAEAQHRIFEPHYRCAGSVCGPASGHGMGLSIVRQGLQTIGGEITVQSEPGRGSCFRARLPATWVPAAPTTAGGGQAPDPELAGAATAEILIIEDDPDLQPVLADCLGRDFRVRIVGSVATGLHQARLRLPDLVVCDLQLPDGEGYAVVDSLKNHPDTSHIPIIVLTAFSDADTQRKVWTSLADDYITKPPAPQLLRLRIHSHIENRRRSHAAALARLSQPRQARVVSDPAKAADHDALYAARLEEVALCAIAEGEINVDALATRMSQSLRTLQRKVFALYGCSVSDYLCELRLRRAQECLLDGASVADAARAAGYSDASYLGRMFRKRFGVTPSEYRNRDRSGDPRP